MPATTALLERALDPTVQPPDDATSERILDAALELGAASGLRHLTMDDVARRAGVGRVTVYRRFGDRARLVDALAVRECRRCLATLAGAPDPASPPEERIADGFVAALRIAREHPLLSRLARLEPEALLAALNGADGQLVSLMRGFVAEQIRTGQRAGELEPGDADEAAEVLVRLGLSFVLIRDSVLGLEDDEAARRLARTLIAPIVVRRSPPRSPRRS
jgi:AcrR family transcriptional regulator